MDNRRNAEFVNNEASEGQILIDNFIVDIYDNGQYCEQMGIYIGFICGIPCQLLFMDNICVIANLYMEEFDSQMFEEINSRILKFTNNMYIFDIRVPEFNPFCLEIEAWYK